MAWLYVPGLADSNLDSGSPSETPTAPWVTLSGKPSQRPFSWRGWRTRRWIERLYGTMLRPSMAQRGAESWISSLRDTRANRSASQDSGAEQETSGTSGPTSLASSASANPYKCSWRTSADTSGLAFGKLQRSYEEWATTLRRVCLRRRRLVRRTEESDYLRWPASCATDWKNSMPLHRIGGRLLAHEARLWPSVRVGVHGEPSAGARHPRIQDWVTPQQHDGMAGPTPPRRVGRYGTKHGGRDLVDQAQTWLTPNVPNGGRSVPEATVLAKGQTKTGKRTVGLESQTRVWATPTQRDWKDGGDPSVNVPTNSLLGRRAPRSMTNGPESSPIGRICSQPSASKKQNGPDSGYQLGSRLVARRLNPLFVEWLMGLPIGWTDSAPVATASFQSWLHTHTELLWRLCAKIGLREMAEEEA